MNCSNCNFEINSNDKFCKNCGNEIKKANKTLVIVRDVILYIISFIFLLVTIIMFFSNKEVMPLFYALICLIFICPITYKLIIKVFKDLDKVHIRVVGIILTLLFSFALIPTDNTNSNLTSNNANSTETAKSDKENNNVSQTNNNAELTEEQKRIKAEEQARLEQEKAQKEAEEKARKEEEQRIREEERKKQEENKRKAAEYREQQKSEGQANFLKIKRAYDNNQISANNTYKGKRVILYGKVVGIKENGIVNSILKTIGVTIEVRAEDQYFCAFCSFDKTERNKLANINEGEYLLFEGECYSWGNYDECKVI